MMKSKMRKLIPAIAMLVISAALMSTSTFAWFSMNTQVTATNMQIRAKSDNTYLLIGSANDEAHDTLEEIQTTANTEVDLGVNAVMYPAAPVLSVEQAALLPASTGFKVGGEAIETAGAQITDAETAAAVTNWYTATAAASDDEAMLEGSARQLTSFGDYVSVSTIYLTVATGANAANNLTVTPDFAQVGAGNDIDSVKFIITTSNGGFAQVTNENDGTAVTVTGAGNITSAALVTVTVYLYVDGDDDAIFTNNTANILGGSLGLTFNVTPVADA